MTERPRILCIGDAHADTAERFEFLNSMLRRRFEVSTISLAEIQETQVDTDFRSIVHALRDSVENTHLVGFGLGACVAIALAEELPKSVQSLTVVAGWLTSPSKMLNAVDQLKSLDNNWQRDDAFELLITSSFGWQTRTPLPRAINLPLLELGAQIDLADQALRVRVPTLVVVCDRDEFASPEQGRLIFSAIPHARLAEVSSGHNVLSERPAELLSVIEAFVIDPSRQPAGTTLSRVEP
jgi:pimeloyl-ACP methyl ester carboxylesterase